ncbi:MAG: tRNA epoxyqueuosine(34) reductase QueG, partial [Luminiphilus sp.]
HGLDNAALVELFAWTGEEFESRTLGSPIRRIGYERWLRNLAIALGNAPTSPDIITALNARSDDNSPLVREHVAWALAQHQG